MKRITLWLCTALLAFIVGVLMTWGYELAHPAIRSNKALNPNPVQSNLSGKMELEFIRFISNQIHVYAQYKVTNGSSEIVHYPGEATNSNWAMFTRQDGWVKPVEHITTGNLFGTQSLLPGDSIIYDAQVPEGKGPFEIGFAYEVGNEHVWDIAWSGKIELPAK
jgi:hypothetical protein